MQLQRNHIKLKHRTLGWPRALRWNGSVLPRVVIPTTVLTLWATAVCFWQTTPALKFFFPSSTIFITVISFVLSLLLGFRTNTAYERYWEGRRLWSNLTVATRNMARLIWVGTDEPAGRDSPTEKTTAMGLILSFLIAVRNHARNNDGLVMDDGCVRPEFEGLLPPVPTLSASHPFLLTSSKFVHSDILYLLNAYVDDLLRRKSLDMPQCGQLLAALNSMNDTVTSMERILTTPIPLAYSLHLKQIMYMYLIMLPFQLLHDYKFLAILITALATFTFVGVELIGSEIENPFGVDANDLRIEEFIADAEVEISELISESRADLADWALDDTHVLRGRGSDTDMTLNITPRRHPVNEDGVYVPLKPSQPIGAEPNASGMTAVDRSIAEPAAISTAFGSTTVGNRVVHSGSALLRSGKKHDAQEALLDASDAVGGGAGGTGAGGAGAGGAGGGGGGDE